MENEEFEGERKVLQQNVAWKRSFAHVNKLQPGIRYRFGNKTVGLHNPNVWTWIVIIQQTESTWIL